MLAKVSFPTRTTFQTSVPKSNHKKTKTCFLKLHQPTSQQEIGSAEGRLKNIFKRHIRTIEDQQSIERPVGSSFLPTNETQSYDHPKRKKQSRLIKRQNSINLFGNGSKLNRSRTEQYEARLKSKKVRVNSCIEAYEEKFKEHKIYGMDNLSHSSIRLPPKNFQTSGTERQTKQYLDKSALLGEIAFRKPLIKQAGNQYFQYLVRDRWKDDLKRPTYIYVLKKDEQFSKSKVVLTLQKYYPNIKQRKGLTLKGRHLSTIE